MLDKDKVLVMSRSIGLIGPHNLEIVGMITRPLEQCALFEIETVCIMYIHSLTGYFILYICYFLSVYLLFFVVCIPRVRFLILIIIYNTNNNNNSRYFCVDEWTGISDESIMFLQSKWYTCDHLPVLTNAFCAAWSTFWSCFNIHLRNWRLLCSDMSICLIHVTTVTT